MKKWILLMAVLAGSAGWAQEYVHETFDAYLLGPINSQQGWGATNFLAAITNAQPASVSAASPCAGPNSLLFSSVPPGKQCVLALYTNFNATYSYTGANHPVLRASFALRKQDARQNFAFMMGVGSDEVSIGTDPGDGTIVVDEVDTGVPFVAGRYVEMAVLYNMSNSDVCVQYNGTNILDWSGTDAPSLTQIVYAAFFRLPDAYEGTNLFVDEVLLDKPTPGTVAWWRYEAPITNTASDHAGHFRAARVASSSSGFVPGSTVPLHDGVQERSNDRARRSFHITDMSPWTITPKMSEWTLEAILSADPRTLEIAGNFQILDWGTLQGFNSTNSQINLVWLRTTQMFSMYLRDAGQSDTSSQYLYPLGSMPADGGWHHLAVVKTGAWLTIYLDYRVVANPALDSASMGYYEFDTNSHFNIGQSLNGGNTSNPYQLLDELRFTARALRTGEFLQFGQPGLVSAPDFSGGIWSFDALTISGRTYRAQTAAGVSGTSWSNHAPDTIATGHYSRMTLPAQTGTILRVIRP